MTVKRNGVALFSFSVILVLSIAGDIIEFVRTLISNQPNSYLFTLSGYIVIVSVVLFAFYKITYKPPKYEKIVNKAQKRQNNIIDGLKSKIETIDDKQRKKQEKTEKKLLRNAQKEEAKAQKQKEQQKGKEAIQSFSSEINRSTKKPSGYKPSPKSKKARRRR